MPYDVFISCKNSDPSGFLTRSRSIGEELCETLRRRAVSAFCEEYDKSDWASEQRVFQAIDEASIFVIVATTASEVSSEPINAEWERFRAAMDSGRKPDAQVVTVLEWVTPAELPEPLDSVRSFTSGEIYAAANYIEEQSASLNADEAPVDAAQEDAAQEAAPEEEYIPAAQKSAPAPSLAPTYATKETSVAAEASAQPEDPRVSCSERAERRVVALPIIALACSLYSFVSMAPFGALVGVILSSIARKRHPDSVLAKAARIASIITMILVILIDAVIIILGLAMMKEDGVSFADLMNQV